MFLLGNSWSERKRAVIKIRAKILDAARSWLNEHNYFEVQGPVLVPSISYSLNSFQVKYFDRKAYLTQGLQPYAEVLASNLGRIYTIAPVFRAEKMETDRHLAEYWLMELAIPNCDLDGLIGVEEQLLSHICRTLLEEAKGELEVVQRYCEEFEKIQPPYPRLTYDDAVGILQKGGFDIQWGSQLRWEHENYLSHMSTKPFFISEFPVDVETFLLQSNPEKPELTMSVDLYAPEGYGEIATGGQPTIGREELVRKIREERVDPNENRWYMDLKRMGSVPYSGFAIGIERLTQWICRLDHIKEASAFPRLVDCIYP